MFNPNLLTTIGIIIKLNAILAGIIALYIIADIANEPACWGILFYNFKYFIIFYACPVLFTIRYVIPNIDQLIDKCVINPHLPYCFSFSLLNFDQNDYYFIYIGDEDKDENYDEGDIDDNVVFEFIDDVWDKGDIVDAWNWFDESVDIYCEEYWKKMGLCL